MSFYNENDHNIRMLTTLTGKSVHQLPPLISEDMLLKSCTKDRANSRPFKTLCSMILERLCTLPNKSVFLMDDISKAFPEKNVSTSIYHLFNVLEGLGYMSRVSGGTYVWFGRESEEATKTLKDLKTLAINQEGLVCSVSGDQSAKLSIARLAEEVLMIFLSVSPLSTITMHHVFFLVFNKEYQTGSTSSFNLSRVFKVFEVLGMISCIDTEANYLYTGPAVESHASFDDIGKVETEDSPDATGENGSIHENTAPMKELVLGTDGSLTIQDYIPVSYNDKIFTEEIKLQENKEDGQKCSAKGSNGGKEINQSFGFVDVKDEILIDNLDFD